LHEPKFGTAAANNEGPIIVKFNLRPAITSRVPRAVIVHKSYPLKHFRLHYPQSYGTPSPMSSNENTNNAEIKRGRPRSETESIGVQLLLKPDTVRQIDDWRRNEDDLPSRPEAIRRLLARSLSPTG